MGTVLKPVVGTNVGTEAIKNPQPVDLQRIADVEVAGFPSGPQAQSSREALPCLPLVSLDSFAFLPPAADSTLCCRSARSSVRSIVAQRSGSDLCATIER